MKHFNQRRELVEGPPAEFWDDIEYQESMDLALYEWLQPRWKKEFEAWIEKQKLRQCGTVNSPHLEQGRERFETASPISKGK